LAIFRRKNAGVRNNYVYRWGCVKLPMKSHYEHLPAILGFTRAPSLRGGICFLGGAYLLFGLFGWRKDLHIDTLIFTDFPHIGLAWVGRLASSFLKWQWNRRKWGVFTTESWATRVWEKHNPQFHFNIQLLAGDFHYFQVVPATATRTSTASCRSGRAGAPTHPHKSMGQGTPPQGTTACPWACSRLEPIMTDTPTTATATTNRIPTAIGPMGTTKAHPLWMSGSADQMWVDVVWTVSARAVEKLDAHHARVIKHRFSI
jgi:hypothetical protein